MTDDPDIERWAKAFRAERTPPDALRRRVRALTATHDLDTWATAYRAERRPPDALRGRILDQAGAVDETPSTPGQWGVGFALGAILGLAALLALAWGVRLLGMTPTPASVPIEAQDAAVPSPSHGRTQPPTQETAHRSVAPELAPPIVLPQPPTPPVARSTHRPPTTPTAPREPAEAPPRDDLEELRLLRAAEQALERGQTAAAVAQLDSHALAYPHSTFMLEREALWLQAACHGAPRQDLERRYRAFFRRPDGAGYRVKVRTACAGKTFDPAQ